MLYKLIVKINTGKTYTLHFEHKANVDAVADLVKELGAESIESVKVEEHDYTFYPEWFREKMRSRYKEFDCGFDVDRIHNVYPDISESKIAVFLRLADRIIVQHMQDAAWKFIENNIRFNTYGDRWKWK